MDKPATFDSQAGRHIVIHIAEGLYAIDASHVVEMHALGALSPHPHGSAVVRGVARVRGRLIPVVDVRHRMGMPPVDQKVNELDSQLAERELEHRQWISELKTSVRSGEPFAGTTDPQACAFGRWLKGYTPPSDRVASLVARFDAPHRRFHQAAARAQAELDAGDQAGAAEIARNTESRDLTEMAGLFTRVRTALKESVREIVVYVEVDGAWRGLAVDAVDSVTELGARRDRCLDDGNPFVHEMASIPGRSEGVFVLDLRALLRGRRTAA